jgi:serine/threonine protein kinase
LVLGIVHRDIKPSNILVFEEKPGEYIAKVSDLGFSIQLESDNDHVEVPQSSPWTAPEWHHRGRNYSEIIKMDIYSFGLVCLWLLFDQQCLSNMISFKKNQSRYLEDLKNKDELVLIATDFVHRTVQLSHNQVQSLANLFKSCLVSNPNVRESDMDRLLQNLSAISAEKIGASTSSNEGQVTKTPWQLFSVRLSLFKTRYYH